MIAVDSHVKGCRWKYLLLQSNIQGRPHSRPSQRVYHDPISIEPMRCIPIYPIHIKETVVYNPMERPSVSTQPS